MLIFIYIYIYIYIYYVCLREGKKHLLPFLREPTCVHHKQSCFLLPFSRPGGILVGKFKYVYCVNVCFSNVNFCARGALYLVLNSYMYATTLRLCNNNNINAKYTVTVATTTCLCLFSVCLTMPAIAKQNVQTT